MASTSKTSNKVTGYLKKIIGPSVGQIFPLTSGNVIIGRNKETAEVWVPDVNVSRSHCDLKYSENGWFIKDLKSVNGTYCDGKRLDQETLYPLQDGAIIHLGPPGDAPVAFVFLTKMPNEQACEINVSNCKLRNRGGTAAVLVSNKNNRCIKRHSDPESSTTNEGFAQRKKLATASSTTASSITASSITASSSTVPDLIRESEESDNLSDCSIASLDSLKTRVRKLSAKKTKQSRNSRNKDTISAASTSASPQLKPQSNGHFDNKPSTSAETLNNKRSRVKKPAISKEFALLSAIFNESENSSPETIKGEEDSQSLLNDSKILIDCEPYPFSQPLPEEKEQKTDKKNDAELKIKGGSLEERLQEATLQVEKLKKDKLHLNRLVKEIRSEQKLKFQVELQKLVEEELMCNICTEVFVKAVTLGCSHTFCEHCITEWKKKQKKCPICREKIASETKILVMDSFVNKAVEQFDIDGQNKRKELLVNREKAKAEQQKTNRRSRGRGRRVQSESSGAEENRQTVGESSNSIGVQIRFTRNSSPSIQLLQDLQDLEDLEVLEELENSSYLTSDYSDLSDDSDQSIEGNAYYGGYGRCYNCGRRGHWANGCPY